MVTLHMLPLIFLQVLSASILQVELKLQHNFKRNTYNLASYLAPAAAAKRCTSWMCCSRLACQVSTVSLSAAQHVYLCLFTSKRICWICHNCVCLQGHRDSFFPFHCNPTKTVGVMIEDAIKVSSLFGCVGSWWGRRRLREFFLGGWAVKRRVLSRTKLWRCSASRRRCQDTLWATYQTSKMLT